MLHFLRERLSVVRMWRIILEWIGPTPPESLEEGDGLALGVLALLVVTVSLPFLFGFH
jgi:hypothetical protein